jgi:hypothetical protein
MASLLAYTMQALWLPKSISDHIDKTIRNFIWSNRGHTKKAWQNNEALLEKLVDNFFPDKDKMWVPAMTQKYLGSNSILSSSSRSKDSNIWRGILKALRYGFCVSLERGDTTLWYDD